MKNSAQSIMAKKSDKIYLSLGSNLSFNRLSPSKVLDTVCDNISNTGLEIEARSKIFHSKAWPLGNDAPDYVNVAIEIKGFIGSPFELLGILNKLENSFGRKRHATNQWAPRTIDIDIIDFKGLVLDASNLILPHPRANLRDFVLLPLKEIAPNWIDPRTNQTITALIAQLPQNNEPSA